MSAIINQVKFQGEVTHQAVAVVEVNQLENLNAVLEVQEVINSIGIQVQVELVSIVIHLWDVEAQTADICSAICHCEVLHKSIFWTTEAQDWLVHSL